MSERILRRKPRFLAVGLDAACWEYLNPLLETGRMPVLAELKRSGCSGSLESVMPPLTPVAWSTIATGLAPSRHGVHDWVTYQPEKRSFRLTRQSDRRGEPFWETLGRSGIRVGLVNVPLTYPAKKTFGFSLPSFGVTNAHKDATYPPDLSEVLRVGGVDCSPPQEILPDHALKTEADLALLFEMECDHQADLVKRAVVAASHFAVDLLVINLMLFDHSNHNQQDMRVVEKSLEICDRHLGELIDGFNPDTTFVFSDHGARRVRGSFLLSKWLSDRGYLAWPPESERISAYRNWLIGQLCAKLGPPTGWVEKVIRRLGLVCWEFLPRLLDRQVWKLLARFLSLRSRRFWSTPRSDVEKSHVLVGSTFGPLYMGGQENSPKVLQRLARDLQLIEDPVSGGKLFSRIEVGSPPKTGAPRRIPSLILDHYDSEWTLSGQEPPPIFRVVSDYFVEEPWALWGEHSKRGFFVIAGDAVKGGSSGFPAKLADIPATILHYFGLSIPDNYAGRPWSIALDLPHEVTFSEPYRGETGAPEDRDGDEDDALQRRLKQLGYLD